MFGTATKLLMLFQVLGLWLLVHLKEYVRARSIYFELKKSIETRK